MGAFDSVDLFKKFRPGLIIPSLDLAYQGTARLCTDRHRGLSVAGMQGRVSPVHIDVSLELWTKGARLVVVGVAESHAAGQYLRVETPTGTRPFEPLTRLEPDDPRTESDFCLFPRIDGAPLAARVGDRVTIRLGLSRLGASSGARDRHLTLDVKGPITS